VRSVPRWVDHDHIEIPATAESEGVIGDGVHVIDEKDARFAVWSRWMVNKGMERPKE